MIKRMIKPCYAAPSVTQTTAGTVERTGRRTAVALRRRFAPLGLVWQDPRP
jgi:hypothetical protein